MDKYNEIISATHGDVDFAELRARLGEVTHVRDVVSDTLNHHHRLAGNAQGKTDIRRLTLIGGACNHALEAQGKAHLACAAVFQYAHDAGSRYSSEFSSDGGICGSWRV